MKKLGIKLGRAAKKMSGWVKSGYKNTILFGASLTYTNVRTLLPRILLIPGRIPAWNYFDQMTGVADNLLFLGAIPLKSNFAAIIAAMNQRTDKRSLSELAFLSLVEPFETAAGLIYKPALKAPHPQSIAYRIIRASETELRDWAKITATLSAGCDTPSAAPVPSEIEKTIPSSPVAASRASRSVENAAFIFAQSLTIHNLHLPTRDYYPVDAATIQKGVEFIHSHVKKGNPVYSHCKAGRGRSVIVMSAYLLFHQFPAIAAAMKNSGPRKQTLSQDRRSDAENRLSLVMEYMRQRRVQVEFSQEKNKIIIDWYLECSHSPYAKGIAIK